jgi:thiol-disulfide isomerase/thioredoxin
VAASFRPRSIAVLIVLAAIAAGCGGGGDDAARVTEIQAGLAETTPEAVATLLEASERPIVLNVWASWCVPCRSEAPLFREANARLGEEVTFVGVAVRDRAPDTARFIAEFDLDGFEHFLDPPGAVPAALGGFGVPLTFFFDAGGQLVELHSGIIDERALALQVDELLRRAG